MVARLGEYRMPAMAAAAYARPDLYGHSLSADNAHIFRPSTVKVKDPKQTTAK
jgi:hypothetical protein